MDLREIFKNRLRELRQERKESQQQVADGLGIPRQHYQKFESGAVLPGLEKAVALADYFNVTVDYLAGRTEERNMKFNDYFSARLRQMRKESGETQAQVAAGIGTATRYYQKLESGENLPGAELLIALADHFQVSLDYLMGRTDER